MKSELVQVEEGHSSARAALLSCREWYFAGTAGDSTHTRYETWYDTFMRRSSHHVGRVRQRLAKMIEAELTEDGHVVRVDPSKLWPNQGFWRIDHRADCTPWEGQFEREFQGRWQGWTIASWDTMTSLLRGFTYDIDGWSVELYADYPHVHPEALRARAGRRDDGWR